MKAKAPIPVTVLTGFLGAGKTTLLNALLSQNHGFKCAIIINEFGAISIDHQLVVGADEEVLELNNGCLCCRVRGDLIKSLDNLVRKQKRFDYVLIETTGLADPGPVVQTFQHSDLKKHFYLDGVVTVADAKHLEKELSEAPEASTQIAYADIILLNKTDLVPLDQLKHLEHRIRKINALARVHHTQRSQIEVKKLLSLKARDISAPLAVEPAPLDDDHEHNHQHDHDHEDHPDHVHSKESDHEHHHHHHDEDVRSIYITEERPLDLAKTEAWLNSILKDASQNIYRSKGILYIKGQARRVVFQGVQMTFEAEPDRLWNVGERKQNQLVFIGKSLDESKIRSGFANCITQD